MKLDKRQSNKVFDKIVLRSAMKMKAAFLLICALVPHSSAAETMLLPSEFKSPIQVPERKIVRFPKTDLSVLGKLCFISGSGEKGERGFTARFRTSENIYKTEGDKRIEVINYSDVSRYVLYREHYDESPADTYEVAIGKLYFNGIFIPDRIEYMAKGSDGLEGEWAGPEMFEVFLDMSVREPDDISPRPALLFPFGKLYTFDPPDINTPIFGAIEKCLK